MKIGIITFHAAFNYGSMLQAYALQTFLEKNGHEVEIINFRTKIQKQMYFKPLSITSFKGLKHSVKNIIFHPLILSDLYRKWYLFDDFMKGRLNLTVECNDIDELYEKIQYDLIITGSDQIWNTQAWDFSNAYFAPFSGKIKKIAYAVSMGPYPEKSNVSYFKDMLSSYSIVLVREKRTALFLKNNNIYDNVKIVIDPTLLLDKNDYENMISEKPLIDDRYIYYYTPGKQIDEYLQIVDNIAKLKNLRVICDNESIDIKKYSRFSKYIPVGPVEFLNLVRNATIVCGASFHLLVFSLIFEKDFYSINGDKDGRINYLLSKLNLEDRIISLEKPLFFNNVTIVDYSKIKNEIKLMQSYSADLLLKYCQ